LLLSELKKWRGVGNYWKQLARGGGGGAAGWCEWAPEECGVSDPLSTALSTIISIESQVRFGQSREESFCAFAPAAEQRGKRGGVQSGMESGEEARPNIFLAAATSLLCYYMYTCALQTKCHGATRKRRKKVYNVLLSQRSRPSLSLNPNERETSDSLLTEIMSQLLLLPFLLPPLAPKSISFPSRHKQIIHIFFRFTCCKGFKCS
jgi:hypothetical protein